MFSVYLLFLRESVLNVSSPVHESVYSGRPCYQIPQSVCNLLLNGCVGALTGALVLSGSRVLFIAPYQ